MSTELTLLSPQVWGTMCNQATVLVKSGFLPSAIKTPEQAIAIMMKGYEVGFPPMQAFSHISIIQGKPCVSAEGQLSLIYKNCKGAKIDFIKLENDECIIEASRPGGKTTRFKFDKADAEAAGLLSKDTWKKYPRAMYRSRCISEMARTLFADAIMGLSYTPEELNAEVEIDDQGQIVEAKVVNNHQPQIEPPKVENNNPPEIYDMNDRFSKKWLMSNAKLLCPEISTDKLGEINKVLDGLHMKDAVKALEKEIGIDLLEKNF